MLTKNDLAGRLLQLATDTNIVEAETIVRSDQLVSVLNIVQYSFEVQFSENATTYHVKFQKVSSARWAPKQLKQEQHDVRVMTCLDTLASCC